MDTATTKGTAKRRRRQGMAAAAAVAAGSAASLGQTVWVGGQNQYWHDHRNWQPQQVPGPTSDVSIPETAGQVEMVHFGVPYEVRSVDCRSSLSVNAILRTAAASTVKNLTSGRIEAGATFTLEGEGVLGTLIGPGPYVNHGTYSYGTAYVYGAEFRNTGTLRGGYSLSVGPELGVPGVLTNSGEIDLGRPGYGGGLAGSGGDSHVLNQGTITKTIPEPVSVGGGYSGGPSFIQQSGTVHVQAGLLTFDCYSRWTGGTMSVGQGAHAAITAHGVHEFEGLASISGMGVFQVACSAVSPSFIKQDLMIDMRAPGRALFNGGGLMFGDATLTNAGDMEWSYTGLDRLPGATGPRLRNTGAVAIGGPGVQSAIDLDNEGSIEQGAALGLRQGAILTNNGLYDLKRGDISGDPGTRLVNRVTLRRPADSDPSRSHIMLPFDMPGGVLSLEGTQGADLVVGSGGRWTHGAEARVGPEARLYFPSGTLTVQEKGNRIEGQGIASTEPLGGFGFGATFAVEGELVLDLPFPARFQHAGGDLSGPGTVRNRGRFAWRAGAIGAGVPVRFDNQGDLRLEASVTREYTLRGDLTQTASGNVVMTVFGAAPGTEHDRIIVTGTATLGGALRVMAAGGFVPQYGQEFVLLRAASLSGQFASVEPAGLPLPGGLRWRVDYITLVDPRVVLRVGCYADCDDSAGPEPLNVNDFVCFQSRFAAGAPYADCDGSGALNVNDFVCFQGRLAAGCR